MGKRKRAIVPKIIWLPDALEDAQRLRAFLKNKNPIAATRAGHALQAGAKQLIRFPEIGRPMNDSTDRRELFIAFGAGSYVLRYIIDKQNIAIIRVWHSKEQRDKN